jgi:NADPH2:quinone reductase
MLGLREPIEECLRGLLLRAAYATRRDRPDLPSWAMLFDNVTIRLLGSDDFPVAAKQRAASDLTRAASQGALSIDIGSPVALTEIAAEHDRVDACTRARVLLGVAG